MRLSPYCLYAESVIGYDIGRRLEYDDLLTVDINSWCAIAERQHFAAHELRLAPVERHENNVHMLIRKCRPFKQDLVNGFITPGRQAWWCYRVSNFIQRQIQEQVVSKRPGGHIYLWFWSFYEQELETFRVSTPTKFVALKKVHT